MAGAYDEARSETELGERLTGDLRDASGDPLLAVVSHDAPHAPDELPQQDLERRGRAKNFGF